MSAAAIPIPTQNPIDDEIKRAHGSLSPEAQQAVSMAIAPRPEIPLPSSSGVPGNIPAPAMPAPSPRIQLPTGQPPVQGNIPAPTGIQLPKTAPAGPPRINIPEPEGMAPAKAELQRLTVPTIDPATGKPTRDSQNKSGIDQIKHAGIRIPLQILDAIGSGLFPQIAMGIPGTSAHHQLLANRAENAEGQQEAQSNEATRRGQERAATEHTQAETEAIPTQTAARQAETEAAKFKTAGGGIYDTVNHKWEVEPPEKDKDQLLEIDPTKGKALGLIPDKDGRYYIPPQAATGLLKPVAATQPKTIVEKAIADNPKITAEELVALTAKAQKEQQWTAKDAAFLRAAGGDPDKPETQTPEVMKKFRDLVTEKIATPTDHGQNMVDPESGMLVRVEPGQHVPKGAMTASQTGSVNAPTMQMRNVAAQASLVHEQTPMMLSEIDRLKNKLGPAMGRWNEFMQGKVGANDPEFAGLRADLLMYSSAVALMHARGRLPENLREEFDRAINAPKQTPENLKAVINKIDDWTAKNMKAMGQSQSQQSPPATDIVTVKTKDGQTGQIHSSQKDNFLRENPGSEVVK